MDNTFELTFSKFYSGFSPVAHLNSLTEMGNAGSASYMIDCDILNPTCLTQGPGLAELGNMSSLNEMMNFIMDVPPENGITYGIGDTKMFQITPTLLSIPILGEEIVSNGGFTGNANGWTLTDFSYADNKVSCNGVEMASLFQTIETQPTGTKLKITFNLSFSADSYLEFIPSAEEGGTSFGLAGVYGGIEYTEESNGTSGDYLSFHGYNGNSYSVTVYLQVNDSNFDAVDFYSGYGGSDWFNGTIDNISIKTTTSFFPYTITNCTQGESVVFMTTP